MSDFYPASQFYVTVSSSNLNGMHFNKHNDFYAAVHNIRLHPGEWEVACVGFKPADFEREVREIELVADGVIQGPFTLRARSYNPFDQTLNSPLMSVKIFEFDDESQMFNLIKDVTIDYSSLYNKEFRDIRQLANELGRSLPEKIQLGDEEHTFPIDFINVNNVELGITLTPFTGDGYVQITLNPILAEMLQITHTNDAIDFEFKSGLTQYIFRGLHTNPVPDGEATTNIQLRALGTIAYTGENPDDPTLPNQTPNHYARYNMTGLPLTELTPLPKLLHVHVNIIEDNPISIQDDGLGRCNVLLTLPAQEKYYIPKIPEYHRLKKSDTILSNMYFTVTDENYKPILAIREGPAYSYEQTTVLTLHFRRMGVAFQGNKVIDVVQSL